MFDREMINSFVPLSEMTESSDCLLHGFLNKLGGPFQSQWQRKYFYLFPNRIEWRGEQMVYFTLFVLICYSHIYFILCSEKFRFARSDGQLNVDLCSSYFNV